MAFGNVCELKGWKYQSHQNDNLNNSYEIEFWEIGLLHAGFQSVWLWMNDIWVTLESLVVKDSLSRWTQKNGKHQPLSTCGHTVIPQHGFMSFVAPLWADDFTVGEVMDHNIISNVFHLHKYEVLMLHFAGLFVYTESRHAFLLPDPFSGTSYCEKKTLSRSYSHVLLINCETVWSASVRLGAVLNYVSTKLAQSISSCCRMSWKADKIILIHRWFAYM